MDNPLTPDQQNVVIEDALYTYPVAPMPRTVTSNVMARIKTIPTPQPFHLTWQDLVLAPEREPDEIAHAVLVTGEAVLAVYFSKPLQRFGNVATGDKHQLHEYFEQFFKIAACLVWRRRVIGKAIPQHNLPPYSTFL